MLETRGKTKVEGCETNVIYHVKRATRGEGETARKQTNAASLEQTTKKDDKTIQHRQAKFITRKFYIIVEIQLEVYQKNQYYKRQKVN